MEKADALGLQIHLVVNHLSVVGWLGVMTLLVAHYINGKWVSRSLIYFLAILCGVMTWATLFSGDETYHAFTDAGIADALQPHLEAHEEEAERFGWLGIMGGVVGMLGILIESRYAKWHKLFMGTFTGLVLIILVALLRIAHLGGMIQHEWLR